MKESWKDWHNTVAQAMQCSECSNKITMQDVNSITYSQYIDSLTKDAKESNVDPEKIEIKEQSTSDVFITTTKDFDGDVRFYVNDYVNGNGDFAFINKDGAKQIIEAFVKIFELDFSVVTVQEKSIIWR